jgi:hypothetical protein
VSFLAATSSADFWPQVLQVVGALCVLAGFAGSQFGVVRVESRVYLVLNLVGSAVLAALAAADSQYGFLLLEGVWAVVSAWAILRTRDGRRLRSQAH